MGGNVRYESFVQHCVALQWQWDVFVSVLEVTVLHGYATLYFSAYKEFFFNFSGRFATVLDCFVLLFSGGRLERNLLRFGCDNFLNSGRMRWTRLAAGT